VGKGPMLSGVAAWPSDVTSGLESLLPFLLKNVLSCACFWASGGPARSLSHLLDAAQKPPWVCCRAPDHRESGPLSLGFNARAGFGERITPDHCYFLCARGAGSTVLGGGCWRAAM
jgi:hypothetical protein